MKTFQARIIRLKVSSFASLSFSSSPRKGGFSPFHLGFTRVSPRLKKPAQKVFPRPTFYIDLGFSVLGYLCRFSHGHGSLRSTCLSGCWQQKGGELEKADDEPRTRTAPFRIENMLPSHVTIAFILGVASAIVVCVLWLWDRGYANMEWWYGMHATYDDNLLLEARRTLLHNVNKLFALMVNVWVFPCTWGAL